MRCLNQLGDLQVIFPQEKTAELPEAGPTHTRIGDQAWHDLTHDNGKPTLDEKRLKAFPAIYEASLKEFEPRYLQLVMTHVGWLRSEQLANWMEAVHDDADIRSGYAYNESVSQCIGHAVCTQPCIDQLTSWISDENLKNPRNLYGRALLYNQADIIAATEPQLKGSDIQVENILNIYKGAIDRLHDPQQATQLIDHLALTTGNVISRSLAKGGQSIARSLAMVHLKLLAGGSLKVSNASATDIARWAITQAQEQGIKLDTHRRQTRADARAEARSAIRRAKATGYCAGAEVAWVLVAAGFQAGGGDHHCANDGTQFCHEGSG